MIPPLPSSDKSFPSVPKAGSGKKSAAERGSAAPEHSHGHDFQNGHDPHGDHGSYDEHGGEPDHLDADGHDHSKGVSAKQIRLVAVSEAAIVLGFLFRWMLPDVPWAATACFGVGTLAGGWLVFPGALSALRRFQLDMNVLMTVAVAGAWIIGEATEGAVVVFLFALAELLESWSVGRARQAIRSLMALSPETAMRKTSAGGTEEIPAAGIQPGEIIVVLGGARVPLDGEVTTGRSAINQAPITGESVPVDKAPGDSVFAGTINGDGVLEIRVTRPADDSTLARIIRQVEAAGESKAPSQRFVDRFARIYTPAVFLLAIGVAVMPPLMGGAWQEWIYRALVLLVIACPCALVIATPVSIVAGLTSLAKRGVLIKGGAALEAVGSIKALAVDKTGTITLGHPRVICVYPWGQHGDDAVLAWAAAVDSLSSHPIAKAVVQAAWAKEIQFTPAINHLARPGRGAEAVIDGVTVFVGNHRMAHGMGVCSPALERLLEKIEKLGQSLSIVGRCPQDGQAGEVFGVLAIGDPVRPEAKESLQRLHAAGVQKVIMLSGDNQQTVSAIAKKVEIDEARGDLLPEQKVEALQQLMREYKVVGMVGDGVNDAPALATASVGIAMGAAGSDTALETADMALMNDDLRNLAEAIHVSRRAVSIIRFNVLFALGVKILFLVLAFAGCTSLWLAILADTGATLLVIANALRLLRFRPVA